ncbi:MAG: 16S rRNA (cytidine(1402)-2'-O)-methyltransferase [Bacteroidetes bacterium]|jgi:16S rRNA (cytidine1402-2'-O)-methyltransferase|nr:16S rRNA (cytidine(1402)-2'-O)-methyltransferase [Bacteroidota bacterium]MBT6686987.1 16S rRNA (cytidine(1402)-2'-O)-methyltransferase [Bacteroidota bacterium]MBT7142411.1 16S rRNA (cytidine(1402)-2'-O)-methyltransferase [Bacteroidota bacterium]MBT7490592.1 16S rRNA (cytidine(1402)-2'-O)-methyltransferase [Bacteroidota bacterium]
MCKLYIIPTPIGNLEDITFRAVRILKEVDLILAEDTRTSQKLLKHYGIEKKLQSYHKFNEHKAISRIVDQFKINKNIALISDAGTPSISDPGFLLVRECLKNNIEIECLPGATALVPALVNSGFASDRFCFEGFLPQKKGRTKRIEQLVEESRTMIFYESPYRLLKTLNQFAQFFGEDRRVSVSRELTKIYEENKRGTIIEVIDYFSEKKIKGEIVIVVEGEK